VSTRIEVRRHQGCLGACWGWGAFDRVLGGGFYRPGGRGEGGQKVADARALATCDGQHRAQRPCARAGGVLSWRRGTVGRLWRAHAGRRHAERRETERGGSGGSSSSPPRLTVRVGAEGAGLDRGGLHEHGYRARANRNSDDHSSFDFLDFCP
jgi:hypothetical protein